MSYSSSLNFFSLSEYTFIRFITSRSKGLPVGWSRGGGGGATLSGRAPLGGRVALGRGLAFWGFWYELKLPSKEYRLALGFRS